MNKGNFVFLVILVFVPSVLLWRISATDPAAQPELTTHYSPDPVGPRQVWRGVVRGLILDLVMGQTSLAQASAVLESRSRELYPEYLRHLTHVEPWPTDRLRLASNLLRHLDAELELGCGVSVGYRQRLNLHEQFAEMLTESGVDGIPFLPRHKALPQRISANSTFMIG